MIKFTVQFFTILLLLISCTQKNTYTEELNKKSILYSGEWISSTDTMAGISIRKNKIAFFEKNKFSLGDVCDYVVVDSILLKGQEKTILNTFLKFNCYTDTIYYEIEKRNDSTFTLNFQNKRFETYNLQRNENVHRSLTEK